MPGMSSLARAHTHTSLFSHSHNNTSQPCQVRSELPIRCPEITVYRITLIARRVTSGSCGVRWASEYFPARSGSQTQPPSPITMLWVGTGGYLPSASSGGQGTLSQTCMECAVGYRPCLLVGPRVSFCYVPRGSYDPPRPIPLSLPTASTPCIAVEGLLSMNPVSGHVTA